MPSSQRAIQMADLVQPDTIQNRRAGFMNGNTMKQATA